MTQLTELEKTLLEALRRLVAEHDAPRYGSLDKRMADWRIAREAIARAEAQSAGGGKG